MTILKTLFCARCDAKARVPVDVAEQLCECGATMK